MEQLTDNLGLPTLSASENTTTFSPRKEHISRDRRSSEVASLNATPVSLSNPFAGNGRWF